MFKIEKDGVISVNKTRKLTQKQMIILKNLDDEDERSQYLQSILGLRKRPLDLEYLKKSCGLADNSRNIDRLAEKEKGSVLDRLNQLCNARDSYSPENTNAGQWIGIEIECLFEVHCDNCDDDSHTEDGDECTHDDAISDLKNRLRSLISEHKITRCSLHEDGSLSDGNVKIAGLEFAILINPKYGFDKLDRLLNLIKKNKGYVNKSCGLHVHLDARHINKEVAKLHGKYLGNALPVLYHMVPESRRDNYFCKPGVSRIVRLDSRNRELRYRAVNMTAYMKYRTIEVRLHSGTLEYTKIVNWIEILKAVIASQPTKVMNTFQDFLDNVRIPDRLVEYMERRMQEFSPGFLNVIPMPQPVEFQLVSTPMRTFIVNEQTNIFDTEVA